MGVKFQTIQKIDSAFQNELSTTQLSDLKQFSFQVSNFLKSCHDKRLSAGMHPAKKPSDLGRLGGFLDDTPFT